MRFGALEPEINVVCSIFPQGTQLVHTLSITKQGWLPRIPTYSNLGLDRTILEYTSTESTASIPGKVANYYSVRSTESVSELLASKMTGQAEFLDLIHHCYPHVDVLLLLIKSSVVLAKFACLLISIHTCVL